MLADACLQMNVCVCDMQGMWKALRLQSILSRTAARLLGCRAINSSRVGVTQHRLLPAVESFLCSALC